MCEYCGCRQIEPLAELMDEHGALLDHASDLEAAISHGDDQRAAELWQELGTMLSRHVRREEDGVFTALRETGEFVEEVEDLEGEHRDFDSQVAGLRLADPDFKDRFRSLVAQLSDHIDREDLGVFPVSMVTLRAAGWDTVARAHRDQPTFLTDRPGSAQAG